jgi:hypothetical protein
MDMFDPKTKQLLIGRAGGSSDLGMGIPKDKERHATQAALAQQQGGVRKEPVLLIKSANGYELLEGWHRTIQHFARYPEGYTGPAYVAVAQGQQGVAEGGAETSWSNDTDTITLQDILELTKHIKQTNLPINDNLKSKLLHWEGNPEEIERVNQVTVSNQFPILIMVDEQGQIAWILDGNHRLHKAIQSQAKTIPAKLIRPSNLDDKAKKIFNIKEQGVAEGSQEINWVKPNFDFEWHEVEEQSRMKQVPVDVRQYYQKHFPNKDAWLKAVQNGKAVVVPPDHAYEIRNAPFDKASLQKVLAPTGHEGPIGPAKEKRVNDLFDKGQVEMPIILKTSQGLWLIGGKTRLGTANYVKGLPAKVWLIGGEQGVAEGKVINTYLWHGSRQKIPMLEPRQSVDTGGATGSNQNAIYATSDPKVAIAMGLTTAGSDTGMFPNDPQMVLFSGKIRKGEYVYLHKLPFNGPDGKPQFVQGGNSREFHSIPGVEGIKPIEIKEIPVNKYLNLIRKATPADLKLRKKYMKKQGVAENFADGKNPGRKGLSKRVGIPKKATLGQLEKIAGSSTGERRRMAQWQLNMRRGKKK